MSKLILASNSPRRKELLEQAGLTFSVIPSGFDEGTVDPHSMAPDRLAEFLALKKARDIASAHPDAVVLGADTFILLNGEIMGKPHTPEEARRMLQALSKRMHSVITGFAIVQGEREYTLAIESKVTVKKLSPDHIEAYIATGEPLDKAGAYAIQREGSKLVKRLEGSVDNVIGLPVAQVIRALAEFKIKP